MVEKKKNQIIVQRRIELERDGRREWLKKEKEIIKPHRGGTKDTKSTTKVREKERTDTKNA